MGNPNLSGPVGTLQRKYLVADGLMLRKENRDILTDVVNEIDDLYQTLMTECALLAENDCLPGTRVKLRDVKSAKHEFDARVGEWLESVESTKLKDAALNAVEVPFSSLKHGDALSVCSRRSDRSSRSSVNFKRKEGFVKLKTAMFAKEREAEKCRLFEQNQKEFDEIEKRAKMAKRQAEELRHEEARIWEARKREL